MPNASHPRPRRPRATPHAAGRSAPSGVAAGSRFLTFRWTVPPGSGLPAENTTSLNFAAPIAVFDQCGAKIAESAAPPTFAIAHVVEVSIAAANLRPPKRLLGPTFDTDVQLARPNALADVVVSISSGTGQALPNASVATDLRGFDVTVDPSGPGVVYSAFAKRFTWSGAIPAMGSVDIHFTGTPNKCRGEVDLRGASSTQCVGMPDVSKQLTIARVPMPPSQPWLAGLAQLPDPFNVFPPEDHVVRIDPGPPVVLTTMLCLQPEYSEGISASAGGDIWVTPISNYRFSPYTLDFQPFDEACAAKAGLTLLRNIAADPVDGSAYPGGGLPGVAKILRYDPRLDTLEPFFDDTGFGFGEIVVDDEGSIAAVAGSLGGLMLLRIDPPAPATSTLLYSPPSFGIADVAIDNDGSYLIIEGGSFDVVQMVQDVDADTGALTPVVADLRVPFPTVTGWAALETLPSGDLILAPAQGGLAKILRSTPDVGEVLLPFTFPTTSITDLAMVPEPGSRALALAALSILLMLRRARVPRAD